MIDGRYLDVRRDKIFKKTFTDIYKYVPSEPGFFLQNLDSQMMKHESTFTTGSLSITALLLSNYYRDT